MKFIQLHTKNTTIIYKNALCSSATMIVVAFIMLSIMIPVLLVSLLSPYSGISESRVLYEQPRVSFKFQHLFLAETLVADYESGINSRSIVACSTFPYFNQRTEEYQKSCVRTKFWSKDLDYDLRMDQAHFQIELNSLPGKISNLDLILFFQGELQHKCSLTPPAILSHRLNIPQDKSFSGGTITLIAQLKLVQHVEFICPFYGSETKTKFLTNFLVHNASGTMEQFQLQNIRKVIKRNPAFFELEVTETCYKHTPNTETKILLVMDIIQVGARYHLSVWERLGLFWLYFASFFGISFYVMNKVKDFLFGRRIIRSWEIIPWKKLY